MKSIMLDFEMTMWMAKPQISKKGLFVDEGNNKRYYLRSTDQEIIQIGAVKIDENYNTISTFESFIKPKYNPQLTGSCKAKTHITQEEINCAASFQEVMTNFIDWAYNDDDDICFYSWCNEDKLQLMRESQRLNFNASIILNNLKDFQKIFTNEYHKMLSELNVMTNDIHSVFGLKRVADWMNISYDPQKLHNALTDSILASKIFINFYTCNLSEYINYK